MPFGSDKNRRGCSILANPFISSWADNSFPYFLLDFLLGLEGQLAAAVASWFCRD